MANTYFQFKQFTVQQEKAALKVSTDSCLFGAWVAEYVCSKMHDVRYVLDIGAGTGLLMLMLAQKCNTAIDGVEIDNPSYQQAKENIEASPWKDRFQLFHADVKHFRFQQQYDFILSNPPFYEGDLKSGASYRNVAMHDEGLKLDELLEVVDANLSADGRFAVLLPYHRADGFLRDANRYNLHLAKRMNIRQSVNHSFFRVMLVLSRKKTDSVIEELPVKDASGQYSAAFTGLLQDYYLYL